MCSLLCFGLRETGSLGLVSPCVKLPDTVVWLLAPAQQQELPSCSQQEEGAPQCLEVACFLGTVKGARVRMKAIDRDGYVRTEQRLEPSSHVPGYPGVMGSWRRQEEPQRLSRELGLLLPPQGRWESAPATLFVVHHHWQLSGLPPNAFAVTKPQVFTCQVTVATEI